MKQLLKISALGALGVSLLMASGWVGYLQGFQKGVEPADKVDFTAALHELRPQAEKGDASAQYNLGLMYYNGEGVIQDYTEAANWYRKAAEHGDMGAHNKLGAMYRKGEGVTQSYKEAVGWYRKGAERGSASAQNSLGVMYNRGWGEARDIVYAHMWFNIAASHGGAHAVKNRDSVATRMTPSQIGDAHKLARECVKKNYIGC